MARKSELNKDISLLTKEEVTAYKETILSKKKISDAISTAAEEKLLKNISSKFTELDDALDKLEADLCKAESMEDGIELAAFYHDPVFTDMQNIRAVADYIEGYIPDEFLPYPTYSKLLFYV